MSMAPPEASTLDAKAVLLRADELRRGIGDDFRVSLAVPLKD